MGIKEYNDRVKVKEREPRKERREGDKGLSLLIMGRERR